MTDGVSLIVVRDLQEALGTVLVSGKHATRGDR
jgi:hypothetical protein